MFTNDIVSLEQLGPDVCQSLFIWAVPCKTCLCAYVDLNLQILRMFEGSIPLDVAHIELQVRILSYFRILK